jgi:hypothetical protein
MGMALRTFLSLAATLTLSLNALACTPAAATATVKTGAWTAARPSEQLTPTVREALATHRKLEIERLHAYAAAGQFPHNTPPVNQPHMFKDSTGRLCAVASLIHQDGHDDIVDSVASTHNGLVVSEEKSGPVIDWVLTSGLTQDEVARIQRPAPMLRPPQPVAALGLAAKLAPAAPTEAEMVSTLRMQLALIEEELVAQTDVSLDKAVSRLTAGS